MHVQCVRIRAAHVHPFANCMYHSPATSSPGPQGIVKVEHFTFPMNEDDSQHSFAHFADFTNDNTVDFK